MLSLNQVNALTRNFTFQMKHACIVSVGFSAHDASFIKRAEFVADNLDGWFWIGVRGYISLNSQRPRTCSAQRQRRPSGTPVSTAGLTFLPR